MCQERIKLPTLQGSLLSLQREFIKWSSIPPALPLPLSLLLPPSLAQGRVGHTDGPPPLTPPCYFSSRPQLPSRFQDNMAIHMETVGYQPTFSKMQYANPLQMKFQITD